MARFEVDQPNLIFGMDIDTDVQLGCCCIDSDQMRSHLGLFFARQMVESATDSSNPDRTRIMFPPHFSLFPSGQGVNSTPTPRSQSTVAGALFTSQCLRGVILIEAIRGNASHRSNDSNIHDYAFCCSLARYVLTLSQIQDHTPHMSFSSVVSASITRAKFPWRVAYGNLKAKNLAADLGEMITVVHIIEKA